MASRAGERDPKAKGLESLVADLGPIKEQMSKLKKQEEKLVAAVKSAMLAAGLKEVVAGGYKANLAEITNDVLNEEAAMGILKHELQNDPQLLGTLVKTKEYLDQDELETAVYQHRIPEGILATAIDHKPSTVRLSCSKQKTDF